jgi:hypothetical protein
MCVCKPANLPSPHIHTEYLCTHNLCGNFEANGNNEYSEYPATIQLKFQVVDLAKKWTAAEIEARQKATETVTKRGKESAASKKKS